MSLGNRVGVLGILGLGAGLMLFPLASAWAQTVVANVPVSGLGLEPHAVAVNPVTNKIYVAGGVITVIDGTTNTTTSVQAGVSPIAVAVNPVTNKIYVANRGDIIKGSSRGNITVIDGMTNATTTVTDSNAAFPSAVAVNPVTNKIYVTNLEPMAGSVTVIDGVTNATTTVKDPNAAFPVAVALNSATNKIYVANANSQNVTVIDGATNAITTVTVATTSELGPVAVAVNPVTNKIYVANNGGSTNPGNITVLDGVANSTTTITDPNAIMPYAVAANSTTNKIYVTNTGDYPGTNHGNITVIDGVTNSTTTVTDPNALAPLGLAVNEVTNRIYVSNGNSSTLSGNGGVTVVDGATNSTTTVTDPNAKTDVPAAIAVDPATDMIYVANAISYNVTVIDGGITTPPSFTLSLTGAGNGSGTVTSSPAGIDCGNSCSASFASGTTVILTASPASASTFTGWSGACSGMGACVVTMTTNELVSATFTQASAPDFSIQPASATLTAQRGGQITDVITITPQNGSFGNAVQLSCAVTGSTSTATCALSPTSVTPGANPATSTLTITAPGLSAQLLLDGDRKFPGTFYAVFLPFPGLAVVGVGLAFGKTKQRRRELWLLCSLFVALVALQVGCGGGSSGQQTQPLSYMVSVTATSGAIQHTAQITVVVP